jgi:hypothetical protein
MPRERMRRILFSFMLMEYSLLNRKFKGFGMKFEGFMIFS